jgi:glycosyltransferase involved in cell wall biosynthesis
MRIVLDLQTAQLHGYERGLGRQLLALAQALPSAPGKPDLHVLLNGALPRVTELREQFDGLLAPEHVRVFDAVGPAAARDRTNAERRRASELVHAYTIAQLQADVLVGCASFDGWNDDSVLSIGNLGRPRRVVLLIDDALASPAPDNVTEGFVELRLALLDRADLVVALSDDAFATAVGRCDETRLLQAAPDQADALAHALLARVGLDAPAAVTPAAAPRTRRRLAFVTPLPPERTGIADYAAQLLPAMIDDFDITLIVQQKEVTLPPVLAALPRHDTAWLSDHAHEFDQLLYQFGNSPFHSDMFALLRQHPGVVVLHDFFLSSVLAYEQMTGGIPNAWSDALFHSHGFAALQASQLPDNHAAAMNDFPCNLEVLEGATRVIVHSEHARELAQEWYGQQAAHNWTVVPLPRAVPASVDRSAARAALGISEDTFLVCTFGYIGPTKLSDVLVRAWLASGLHRDAACELVLVGVNPVGKFGQDLLDAIDDGGADRSIRITGWADEATYHLYLQAADLAVQLRSTSRGETSAAVLDTMNYGVATIVNANGSMAALPQDGVWMLPDHFVLPELIGALETLRLDTARRTELGGRARDILRNQHRPDHCATLYRDALDLAYADAVSGRPALLHTLADLPSLRADDTALRTLALSIARAPDPLAPRQLLVDVSTIVQHDLRTGIERVVRTQLLNLLQMRQHMVRVEPVYLSTAGGRWHYRYARKYATNLLDIVAPALPDAPIDFQPGDLFYCADYAPGAIVEAARAGIYTEMRNHGVSINFLIHDLLPVLRPEFFPTTSEQVHAAWLRCIAQYADRLLCISDAVADEARDWLRQQPGLPARQIQFTALHHGADFGNGALQRNPTQAAIDIAATLGARPSFLMVGTIEPRKGHLQALAAFEELWTAGEQVNLVIVGNEGWKGLADSERRTIPKIVSALTHHPEAGQRLLWLQGVDDSMLDSIYRASVCLLAPSEGEGFGLPLIEAAHYGLPILARDLPVFKEVAGEHAMYFGGAEPAALAEAVRAWLKRRLANDVPTSSALRARTWRENAEQLLDILTGTGVERSPQEGPLVDRQQSHEKAQA